jgi:dipeptidyl aminopeptidase/acylaminoacyl peptidase
MLGLLLVGWTMTATAQDPGSAVDYPETFGPQLPEEDPDGYRTPPAAMVDLVDAPRLPTVMWSPDHRWMVLLNRQNLLDLEELARPEHGLAGIRFNPDTRSRSRVLPWIDLEVQDATTGETVALSGVPADARIRYVSWSPDGGKLAFTTVDHDGMDLWVADVEAGRARRLVDGTLNAVLGKPYVWMADSETLVATAIPGDEGEPPAREPRPEGPVIQVTGEKAAPMATYQDLLADQHDEALFSHYVTSQLVKLSVVGGSQELGLPAMVLDVQPSPNGEYLLVQSIHPPFSYQVPLWYFPRRVEVWTLAGKIMHEVADLPLHPGIGPHRDAVVTGPRQFAWRQDAPASLVWVEARDGGDPTVEVEVRDEVFIHRAPFEDAPGVLARTEYRFGEIQWGDDDLALLSDWRWSDRRRRVWLLKPGLPSGDPELVFDYNWQDRYRHPGTPSTTTNPQGATILLTDPAGEAIYLVGDGATQEGTRPFLDRLDLVLMETERLWRAEGPVYERPVEILDPGARRIVTRRESKVEPPNYVLRDLELDGEIVAELTDFPHPAPQLLDAQKELVRYTRADGVALSATLYLPPGYSSDQGPLPMLMWAYPREHKSADTAGQITDSPHSFDYVSWVSPLIWLTQGIAVLDDVSMPIVGEGDAEPNDTFVDQLRMNAEAAIDEMVRRGVAEPDRIVIGGHSYGAFMAANLLAHTDLFAGAIARAGAYNRTLTPFGFQAEARTFWQAPEVYATMSPFFHAEAINEPILLIHGALDNNPGTYPMQSERLFAALKGLGGDARLVMLPFESHGYRARESVLHVLWEQNEFIRRVAGADADAEADEADAVVN